jgi:tRNA pseudouridine38-40 synthase
VTDSYVDEPAGVPDRSGPGGLVRLRLDVAYDGADFHGWARQPGLRSVQAELELALRAVLRVPAQVPVRVAVAGRTDAGVHATGQVCHADVPLSAWAAAGRARAGSGRQAGAATTDPPGQRMGMVVQRRLNGLLAPDLRVRGIAVAPAGFDARWSASWRRYEYLVADTPSAQDPRTRGHVLWHPRALDVAAMDRAARPFAGEHDFVAFCRARPDASTVRTIHELSWHRAAAGEPGGDGPAVFAIRADAFCHSMVRSLVGAFLAVGDGRWPVERPQQLLRAGQRVPVIATAAPHGLTLVEVGYPPPEDLAAQARRARRWRGPGQGRM